MGARFWRFSRERGQSRDCTDARGDRPIFAYHRAAAALLVTAYSISYGVFQLIYGQLAGRIGKVRTIVLSLCPFALGTIGCAAVDSFSSLMPLRVVTGMFAAGVIPTSLVEIGDRFPFVQPPRAIAFFLSLATSGQALGIVIGGIVAQFLSYRYLLARYKVLLRLRFVWLIYALVLCEGLVFFGEFTLLGIYGVKQLHLSYFVIGLLTATYSLGAFVGSRTIARAISRVGTGRMPILGAGIMTLSFGVIWAWQTVAGLAIGFVVFGFGFSYCHATLQTHATDLLPTGRATAMSLFAFSLFIGGGIGPMLTGYIYDAMGMRWLLGVVTVGMGVFAVGCLLLVRTPKNSDEQPTLAV